MQEKIIKYVYLAQMFSKFSKLKSKTYPNLKKNPQKHLTLIPTKKTQKSRTFQNPQECSTTFILQQTDRKQKKVFPLSHSQLTMSQKKIVRRIMRMKGNANEKQKKRRKIGKEKKRFLFNDVNQRKCYFACLHACVAVDCVCEKI